MVILWPTHQISSHWWRPGYNPTILRAELIHPGKLTFLNPTKKGLEFGLEDDVPLQLGDWLGSKCLCSGYNLPTFTIKINDSCR